MVWVWLLGTYIYNFFFAKLYIDIDGTLILHPKKKKKFGLLYYFFNNFFFLGQLKLVRAGATQTSGPPLHIKHALQPCQIIQTCKRLRELYQLVS
jgi:hypothetical protein